MIIKKENSFRESLKKIKLQDVVYPGIFLIFFGIVIILFFFSTQFISKNINKGFYSEGNSTAEALNLEQYKLVAKKLGIVVNVPKEGEVTTIKVTPPVETVVTTIDKKAISIIVKNSTTKSGIATTLAKAIEDAGFNKPKTGNEATFYATTTVMIKVDQKDIESQLLDVVHKSYPEAIATTTVNTGVYDAIVVIGVK